MCNSTQPYQIDQGIVPNANYASGGVPGFGSQSLRFSNLCANGAFSGTQIYSPQFADPAGENESNKVFTFEFSIRPTKTTYQSGLYTSVSPDNGTGFRQFRVDLTDVAVSCGDSPSCVLVSVADSPTGVDGYIVSHAVALLDPAKPHAIKVWMKFNPGEDNDIVRVLIDGTDTGQCFASWENYYRTWQPGNFQNTSDIQFRANTGGFSGTNAGYLFDNVNVTTSTGAGPPGCDEQIEKQADAPTVTAGGLAGYRISVRNRGTVSERNLLLCDHVPNHTTFVSASRKLRRIGNRRCLTIPRLAPGQRTSVHIDFRVAANTPPGGLANIADIRPVPPPGVSVVPPALVDLPPRAVAAPIRPIAKARVLVRVLAAAARHGRPRVTG